MPNKPVAAEEITEKLSKRGTTFKTVFERTNCKIDLSVADSAMLRMDS